jgi:hypothetical protein
VDSRDDRQRCGTLFQDVCRCEDSQWESQGEQLIQIPNTRQHRLVSHAFDVPKDSKAARAYEEEVEDLDPSYGRSSSYRPEDKKQHDQETEDRGDKLGCKRDSGSKGSVASPPCDSESQRTHRYRPDYLPAPSDRHRIEDPRPSLPD